MKFPTSTQLLARTGAASYLFWGLAILCFELAYALDLITVNLHLWILLGAVWGFTWLLLIGFGARAQAWILRFSMWSWFATLAYLLGITIVDLLANPDLDGSGKFTVSDLWPMAKLLGLSPGYIALELYGELDIFTGVASFLELERDRRSLIWLQVWSLSLLHYMLPLLILWLESRAHNRFGERLELQEESPYLLTTRRRLHDDQP